MLCKEYLVRSASWKMVEPWHKLLLKEQKSEMIGEKVRIRFSNVVVLIAADGIGHPDCLQKFYLIILKGKLERPETDYVVAAIAEIFLFLENNYCQHALPYLISVVTERVPDEQAMTLN